MLGYLVTYGYIFIIILGVGTIVSKIFNKEISRKIIHLSLFMVWVFIDIFFKNTIHQIIIPFSFLVINTLSYKLKLFKAIERDEDNHLGTIYFAIAVLIIMTLAYFIPSLYIHTGVACFCLTFLDAGAGLFGVTIKSKKIYKNKSLSGFLGGMLFNIIGLTIFKFVFYKSMGFDFIILLSIICAIFELVDYGLDNFSIIFVSLICSYVYESFFNNNYMIGLVLAIIVFLIVFFSSSITYYGSLLSMFIVFSFMYFGGTIPIIYLLLTYFIIFIISKLKKKIKKEITTLKKEKQKSFLQIFVNGFTGTLCIILYGTSNIESMLIASLICIGGSFIDSISSDIGVLSKNKPYDIFKRKFVDTGLSGGVSLLGTISSVIFACLLSLYITLCCNLDILNYFLILSLILSNTIIDTILGSLIQEKKKCVSCNQITETDYHCEKETIHFSGIKGVDNNFVNFLSSFIVYFLSIIIV